MALRQLRDSYPLTSKRSRHTRHVDSAEQTRSSVNIYISNQEVRRTHSTWHSGREQTLQLEGDADLDAHVHAGFLQVHVQAGNLGLDNSLGHAL